MPMLLDKESRVPVGSEASDSNTISLLGQQSGRPRIIFKELR